MEEKQEQNSISKELSRSFSSLKTNKLGRKLSRSMSIVTTKLPEKRAAYLSKTAARIRQSPLRGRKGAWSFELVVIAPDKTQRQVVVQSSQKIIEIIEPLLKEFGLELDEKSFPEPKKHSKKNHKVQEAVNEILIDDKNNCEGEKESKIMKPPKSAAMLILAGSRAPVDVSLPVSLLEGEVIILQDCAPAWDGVNLSCFLQSEKQFGSTISSAIELYAKPLLKADIISKVEHQILFFHLHCVSKASFSLCERLEKYLEAGILKANPSVIEDPMAAVLGNKEENLDESILDALVSEGFLCQNDIDQANTPKLESPLCTKVANTDIYSKDLKNHTDDIDEVDCKVLTHNDTPSILLSDYDIPVKNNSFNTLQSDDNVIKLSDIEKHADESFLETFQSYLNDKELTQCSDNLWQNVRWNFIEKQMDTSKIVDVCPEYLPMDTMRRSFSDIKISSNSQDNIYESLENVQSKLAGTPYESIDDIYECIKGQSNPNFGVCDENIIDTSKRKKGCDSPRVMNNLDISALPRMARNNSGKSLKSGSFLSYETSFTSDSNKLSDEASDTAHSRDAEYYSDLFPNRSSSENYECMKIAVKDNENMILLNQLVNGDLMDVYSDFLSGYAAAKNLLREKLKNDDHFPAQADLRKGAARFTIDDYLELPIERLAQYERLAGGGAGTGTGNVAVSGAGNGGSAAVRRRGQRLSDLERVQHLFPNDFLALHEHDVIAATAGTLKTKALLRKRPSLEAAVGAGVSGQIGGGSPSSGRQFLMEAPCTIAVAQSILPVASPNAHSQDRHLFLFTDLLLVAKSRGNNSFKLKEAVRLSEIWVAAGSADTSFMLGWAGSGAPANGSPPTTYSVTYPTQAARDSWLRKIQNALNSQLTFEPKTTNIQIVYKDSANGIEFCKTLSVTPEMTTAMVIRQALQLVQGGVVTDNGSSWGPARDFCLWAKPSRESTSIPLIGCERPHAIQMARIRQTLSSEEGFDLEHVNSRNNPCGMIFELRKINKNIAKPKTPLKLFKGVSSGKLFGVALGRLCVNGALPPTVLTMLRAVHRRGPLTQGIFRKSANVRALKHLREKVDNIGMSSTRCPELDSAPVLLVASLLKDFLRSLPQPLMCDTFYPGWISVLGLTTQEKIQSMRSLLLKLPKPHYNLLSHFIALLQAIARKSSINLMCPMNLAVCVGPSLLWPTHPCETAPKAVPLLIELLIIHAETLFGPQVNSIFGKGSPEPSASLSLDSGAEESDSLHSVGLSLDSLDLTCPRKEKLSLSRDSGLTLSEDDSNSNGGNSPAPRNGQIQQVLPQTGIRMHQAQKVYAKCCTTNLQNITGFPKANISNYDVARKRNMFAKSTDIDVYGRNMANENIYGTNADVKKTIESQQKIYNAITAQNHYNSNYHDSQGIYGTANQTNNMSNNRIVQNGIPSNVSMVHNNNSSPSKYLTGFEPEKPPRLGLSRATRSAKVQSMHVENDNQHNMSPARLYCRAKSSEDLLERRNDRIPENIYGTRGSQENIYGNVNYDNRSRHIRPKLQKSQTQFDSEKLNPSLQSYSRVYGGWEERVSKLTNNTLYKNESSYSKEAFLNNSNESHLENIYDSAPGMSKRLVHHQQDCGQPPNSTIFTRKDWSRQASRTKSLEVSTPDDSYQPGDYHTEEDNQNMPIYMTRNEVSPMNHDLRGVNSNQRHGNPCKMRSVDPAHVCTKNCSSLNVMIENNDSHKNQANPLQNSHSMKNIAQNSRTVETKKYTPISKANPRKVNNNSKIEKNIYGNKLVHSKSLANIVLHSNSSSNDTLYQPSNKYLSHDLPASSENSASNRYNPEYSDHIYGSSRQHIDVFCENIYGRMGSRDAIYSSDIYTAKPTSVANINKCDTDHQNSSNNSLDHKAYDGNIGRSLPIPPPVPPRKGSHNSPLKNLPPVHLINDDRKTRSKSTSILREPSQEAIKVHSLNDDNAPINLRAPITSYHLGKSEKFILDPEDSGTDTESESYV